MKIIYSGGYNKHVPESVQHSMMYRYEDTIKKAVGKGKAIALVTLAKPDGYYNPVIISKYQGTLDVIDSTKINSVVWESYDGIFIAGGNTVPLVDQLQKSRFDLRKLKQDTILVGDSAGAYALSSYFYASPVGKIRFLLGLYPDVKLITIAHRNNPVYCNESLVKKVNIFANEHGLKVLELAENEQKMFQDGEFIEVKKESLFF